MRSVKFETKNLEVLKHNNFILDVTKLEVTREDAIIRLRKVLPESIKLGCGGSHVWAANQNNERLFIISGYKN